MQICCWCSFQNDIPIVIQIYESCTPSIATNISSLKLWQRLKFSMMEITFKTAIGQFQKRWPYLFLKCNYKQRLTWKKIARLANIWSSHLQMSMVLAHRFSRFNAFFGPILQLHEMSRCISDSPGRFPFQSFKLKIMCREKEIPSNRAWNKDFCQLPKRGYSWFRHWEIKN